MWALSPDEDGLRATLGMVLVAAYHVPFGYYLASRAVYLLAFMPAIAGALLQGPDEDLGLVALLIVTPVALAGIGAGRSLAKRPNRQSSAA